MICNLEKTWLGLTPVILETFWSIYSRWEWTGNLILLRTENFCLDLSNGNWLFSGTLSPSANYLFRLICPFEVEEFVTMKRCLLNTLLSICSYIKCNKNWVINKHINLEVSVQFPDIAVLLFRLQRQKPINVFLAKYAKLVPWSWVRWEKGSSKPAKQDNFKSWHERLMKVRK